MATNGRPWRLSQSPAPASDEDDLGLRFWRAKAAVCKALSQTLVDNPEKARQSLTTRYPGGDKPCYVSPGLYLGSWQTETDETCLQLLGVTHVLQVGRELFPSHPDSFVYKHVDVYDLEEEDIIRCLPDCFLFIDEAREKGAVLVHCAAGVSRSAAVVIAYVMSQRCCSYDTALAVVRAARSVVNPNKGFILQLQEWEKMEWEWEGWMDWDLARFLQLRHEQGGHSYPSVVLMETACKAAPRLASSKRSSSAGDVSLPGLSGLSPLLDPDACTRTKFPPSKEAPFCITSPCNDACRQLVAEGLEYLAGTSPHPSGPARLYEEDDSQCASPTSPTGHSEDQEVTCSITVAVPAPSTVQALLNPKIPALIEKASQALPPSPRALARIPCTQVFEPACAERSETETQGKSPSPRSLARIPSAQEDAHEGPC